MPDHKPLTADDILTLADVAAIFHAAESTVADWARRGVLPSRKLGKRRIFLRAEIEEKLANS